ncbi:MAG TPA: BTAD domain-containing putative transcriptional regulator [Streptosporangiaceae bacterium]|nr:BTAD domain-containing putative transcriptional regulator [Streptosporangiaceae bacterium]
MMRFRLLGPLELRAGEEWQGIGAPKWRSVLAALLINAGQPVPADVLINEVWHGQDTPPAKATNLISIYVLRLRRLLGDTDGTLLVTRAPGYLLRLAPGDTDAQVFEALVREGRSAYTAGDPKGAAAHLAEALALWHGSPLADVPATTLVESEAERLTDLQLDARELRVQAELACGSHAQVIPELRRLLADHALRENLWLLLMQALDGAGRHAEALDAYGQARSVFAEELGVDPGAELRRFHADLLARDDVLTRDEGDSPGSISAGTVVPSARPTKTSPVPAEAASPRPVPVPAQLPADVADFTGRGDQVRHLCDVLSSASADADPGVVRIALVAGSGGLGKTSLAVHAAHRVRASFPDGQLYVDLLGATSHPLPPADVLARFLRDLGVDGRDVPVDDDERAARYRTVLAGRRMLVVLDNARDAAQVRLLLPGTASCAVLVTTRSRMPDLASTRLVDLNVLDDDEALTLFTRVVGDERAAAEPEATAELLLACAGLPLAIRICAARLASRSGWTIRTMANRLRDEHRRLDELRAGDLAVRASFQVSFASLPAVAQPGEIAPADAFRLLGLWQGPSISSAAAAALFGTQEYLAEDALETLVDTHLLESTSADRYKFHDLLRVYSSERAVADLAEADRAAAIGRLLEWYMRTADIAALVVTPHRYNLPLDAAGAAAVPLSFDGVEDALSWYDSERANVVAATRQATECGLHEVAWRLPAALFAVFNRRGNWADCVTTHRIALENSRRAGNRRGEGWVLNNLGEALEFAGAEDGTGYLTQALAIRHEIGDLWGEAQTSNNLADAYVALGRTDEAIELMRRARDLNREAGVRYGEGVALNNLGEALLSIDRLQEAIDSLVQARQLFAEIESPHGVGYALHNLGRCFLALGHDAEALDCLRQALAVHQATGDRHRQAFTLRFLGIAQSRTGLVAEARESWAQAAAIFDDLGDAAQAAEVHAEQVTSGISGDFS